MIFIAVKCDHIPDEECSLSDKTRGVCALCALACLQLGELLPKSAGLLSWERISSARISGDPSYVSNLTH